MGREVVKELGEWYNGWRMDGGWMDVKSACAQDVRFVGAETITGEVMQ